MASFLADLATCCLVLSGGRIMQDSTHLPGIGSFLLLEYDVWQETYRKYFLQHRHSERFKYLYWHYAICCVLSSSFPRSKHLCCYNNANICTTTTMPTLRLQHTSLNTLTNTSRFATYKPRVIKGSRGMTTYQSTATTRVILPPHKFCSHPLLL